MSEGEDRDPYEEAKKRGCILREPALDELFVDIDDEASLAVFKQTLEILNREAPVDATYVMTPSPSGKPHHFHIVVKWSEDITDERLRLGLQAILGSDRTREALCWNRVELCLEPVTVFFEKEGFEPPVPPAPEPEPEPAPQLQAAPQTPPQRYLQWYWVEFSDRGGGTVEGCSVEHATINAREFGNPTRLRALPYPANPRLLVSSDCPSFCFAPTQCADRSSCPQRRACSE